MNQLSVFLTFALFMVISTVAATAISDAPAKPDDKPSSTAGQTVRIAEHRYAGFKRPDPFADYGHFRFGKRAPQPSFADYGHLRFGKRAPSNRNQPSYADYGHLRFGRSASPTTVVDEAEIYQHDFDDINDV
ncbi:hypothetical protein BV898_05366 [Hypsibius exemplaris]|uniref:Uncharacterized protein n=1 Tax=Hypsibius exemplaris TaxID=2072580 RepID=A0A1W0X007_HYPEX|nr:hypothetical protein BV898_05366 [Hypsibius exemplaris]